MNEKPMTEVERFIEAWAPRAYRREFERDLMRVLDEARYGGADVADKPAPKGCAPREPRVGDYRVRQVTDDGGVDYIIEMAFLKPSVDRDCWDIIWAPGAPTLQRRYPSREAAVYAIEIAGLKDRLVDA